MIAYPPGATFLSEHNIPFRLFNHTTQIHSLEQVATERDQNTNQIIKSILFRLSDSEFILVLTSAASQISWPKIRTFLGKSRISLASETEVYEITGYQIGAVSPFGTRNQLRILIDETVLLQSEISIGSGIKWTAIIMKTSDLKTILDNCEIGSFAI